MGFDMSGKRARQACGVEVTDLERARCASRRKEPPGRSHPAYMALSD